MNQHLRKSAPPSRWLLIAGLCLAWLTAAAQSSPPVGIVDAPCPPASPPSPQLAALIEKFLAPGSGTRETFLKSIGNPADKEAYEKQQREQRERDWPNLCKYRADNLALAGKPRPQVVFMGDSITENWALADPDFFTQGRVDRGISGQTTPQMLLRFYADVVSLRPSVVHLMTGTNDIAGNTGPITLQDYQGMVLAMVELAQAHQIKVVLAGIPPAENLFWPDVDPRPRIREINAWLQQVAKQRNLVFVDYAAVLADLRGAIKDSLSNDGVHPNRLGYAEMKPLAEHAIQQALLAR